GGAPSSTKNAATLTGNTAHLGGGSYSYANGVVLNAGYITNNTAYLGGGVYSEGNSTYFTTLHMYNVLVTNNSAEQGGGMWFCPTGTGEIYVTNGGAVTSNTADDAGDDIVFAYSEGTSLTLADRLLGGGKISYYKDGSIYMVSIGDFYPSSSGGGRYDADSEQLTVLSEITANTAAIAVVESSATALAEAQAALYITGNTATYGGGVGSNGGVVIGTNETTELTVTKTWEHKGNPEENQPDTITLQLVNTYNGTDYVIETVTVSADANGKWSYTFENLPTDGNYSVREVTPDYYTAEISDTVAAGEGYAVEITNTYHEAALTVSKSVTGNYGDKTTEFHFTVTLGDAISGTYGDMTFENGVASFTLKDGESVTATSLPAGITYVVEETEANEDGYTAAAENVEGTLTENETAVVTFTNDRDVYLTISGSKTWDDANDQDGKRPESITVRLYADGEEIASTEITEADGWSYSFTGLPKYDSGVEIVYTITEDAVAGYTTTYDGYDITNSYTPGQVSVTVTKAWSDGNDQDGIRPASVTVTLVKNGVATNETVTLNAANSWTASFTGLDEYTDGELNTYTVQETAAEGYISTVTGDMTKGYVITNSHTPTVTPTPSATPTDTSEVTPTATPVVVTPTTTPVVVTPTTTATSPSTGDESNALLWLGLLLLCAGGVAAVTVVKKRKDQ
ncbi:MAG: Cna B-type domain-containing protein, partial [Clostridiales bacterium]|nr:Cna B-type domain-containing protein [Clostridiales bacterium]